MDNLTSEFELYKIAREIQMHGETYHINELVCDEYGKPTGEQKSIVDVRGIFHTSKGYITENISDGTKTHSKGQPLLLLKYEDSEPIQNGHILESGSNRYKVVEKNNIQLYNIVCDISLELVVNGKN